MNVGLIGFRGDKLLFLLTRNLLETLKDELNSGIRTHDADQKQQAEN